MKKELKQLQTKNLLKPRMYSFDEVKALLKEQREEIVKMIEKMPNVEITTKQGNKEIKVELKAKFTKDILSLIKKRR